MKESQRKLFGRFELSLQPDEIVPLADVERRYVLEVLEAFGGNKTRAARALGVTRAVIYRKLDGVRKP